MRGSCTNLRLMSLHNENERQELILVRHGQSTANATGVWQGQLDFPLSELGRRQAAEAGQALRGTEISGAYASPLSRAFETATILAEGAGYAGEVVPVPGLMERKGGMLEGHTWAEQEARDPEFAEKFLALPEEERWTLVGAETDEDILARFVEALSSVRAKHAPDDRLLIVSHGGVMRAFLRDLFGEQILPGSERAPNASITRLLWSKDGTPPELLELAADGHLTP